MKVEHESGHALIPDHSWGPSLLTILIPIFQNPLREGRPDIEAVRDGIRRDQHKVGIVMGAPVAITSARVTWHDQDGEELHACTVKSILDAIVHDDDPGEGEGDGTGDDGLSVRLKTIRAAMAGYDGRKLKNGQPHLDDMRDYTGYQDITDEERDTLYPETGWKL